MSFFASRLTARGSVPRTRELPLAASQAGLKGALMVRDGSGNLAECGADPASICGVANSDFGADTSGFIRTGKKEFPPGYMQVTKVDNEQRFTAEYVGTLPAADGGSYGVVRDTDSRWKVDFSDTTNTRVKLIGRRTNSPENVARVEVIFLAANVQLI